MGFMDTGHGPVFDEKVGRPRESYKEQVAQILRSAYTRYSVGACILESVITKQYRIAYHIITSTCILNCND